MGLAIGDQAPEFHLPGADGRTYALTDFAKKKILVILFTCNHCPYAQAYDERLEKLATYYSVQGVQFIAVNPNDASTHPADSYDAMKERWKEKVMPYPYLRDESQAIAKAYDAKVTPECFVFDKHRKLSYRGRVDDNWKDVAGVKEESLKEAISTLLSGGAIPEGEAEKDALGCSIKWKFPKDES